jgi:glycosyltransferase involved in cell wall biosynthesis
MPNVLCSISTRGRTHTTLPMALQAIINQTRKPDKLVIFDDNDEHQDLRSDPLFSQLFRILDQKEIAWEWLFAGKKGQHHNHQIANWMGYEWVWRVDDDALPEPNVLQNLLKHAAPNVGGVGGSVFTPPHKFEGDATGKIDNIYAEPNPQWQTIKKVKEVDHLHCTFLYRAGIYDYNLGLSRVAHREETLFTFGLKQKGYKLLVVPSAVTWHLKAPSGGIRMGSNEAMFAHDEQIFRNTMAFKDHTIVVLNGGMGDHLVFSHVLPAIKNPVVFGCYPEIIPSKSIAEAQSLFGDIEMFNIYGKMNRWNWKSSLEDAYRKLYT